MSRQMTINATEGHRSFGKLLKRLYRSDEHIVVERDGFPVAVFMSYEEYERLIGERALAAFKRFSSGLGQEAEQQGLTEEQLVEAVRDAKRQVFEERYGRRTN